MTETEMISLLEKRLLSQEIQVTDAQRFFDVGEWLLAFEALYVSMRSAPENERAGLDVFIEYFGLTDEDLSELNNTTE